MARIELASIQELPSATQWRPLKQALALEAAMLPALRTILPSNYIPELFDAKGRPGDVDVPAYAARFNKGCSTENLQRNDTSLRTARRQVNIAKEQRAKTTAHIQPDIQI